MPRRTSQEVSQAESTVLDALTYNRFVAGVQPTRIELGEVSASAKPSDFQELDVRVDSHFKVQCLKSNAQARTFEIDAQLELHFIAANDQQVGQFTCLYHLSYLSAEALSDALLEEFARRNAPVNVWPFMRELVLNLTQRFGWTGFVLPSFLIPPSPEKASDPETASHDAEVVPASKKPRKAKTKA